MDVFVFPSLWEGLGIVAIEAQTAGLPCIVSNVIPKEIDLGIGLVHRMSLDSDAKAWADRIVEVFISNRYGQAEVTKKMNYDVKDNAKIMQKFYLRMDKKMRI